MDPAIQQLIDAVMEVAPAIWEIMLRQVYVEAYGFTIASALILIVGMGVTGGLLRNEDDNDRIAAGVIAIFAIAALFATGYGAFGRFYNPSLYAIKMLIATARGQ